MKRFPLSMLICVLVLLMSVIFVTAKVAQATSTWSENWRIVNSPNMGSDNNQVTALSAVSTNDVWATGSFTIPGTQTSNGLIQHWDGSRWSIIPSPNAGTQDNFLEGVVAISTSNVWAVGLGINGSGGSTLILHWNGTQWNVVPSPNPGSTFYSLGEARAVSANDIWSVGQAVNNNGVFKTLIEHWNGTKWNIVPSPNVGSNNNFLNSVTTVSANNVWAVGTSTNNSKNDRTLTMHWDGSQWSVVNSPNVGSQTNDLFEVAAASANDIWTVGRYINNKNVSQTLIQHWDGSKWSIVPSPNFDLGNNILQGLTVISTNDVWAVGEYDNSGNIFRTLIQHCC